jgi:hypothetical protein
MFPTSPAPKTSEQGSSSSSLSSSSTAVDVARVASSKFESLALLTSRQQQVSTAPSDLIAGETDAALSTPYQKPAESFYADLETNIATLTKTLSTSFKSIKAEIERTLDLTLYNEQIKYNTALDALKDIKLEPNTERYPRQTPNQTNTARHGYKYVMPNSSMAMSWALTRIIETGQHDTYKQHIWPLAENLLYMKEGNTNDPDNHIYLRKCHPNLKDNLGRTDAVSHTNVYKELVKFIAHYWDHENWDKTPLPSDTLAIPTKRSIATLSLRNLKAEASKIVTYLLDASHTEPMPQRKRETIIEDVSNNFYTHYKKEFIKLKEQFLDDTRIELEIADNELDNCANIAIKIQGELLQNTAPEGHPDIFARLNPLLEAFDAKVSDTNNGIEALQHKISGSFEFRVGNIHSDIFADELTKEQKDDIKRAFGNIFGQDHEIVKSFTNQTLTKKNLGVIISKKWSNEVDDNCRVDAFLGKLKAESAENYPLIFKKSQISAIKDAPKEKKLLIKEQERLERKKKFLQNLLKNREELLCYVDHVNLKIEPTVKRRKEAIEKEILQREGEIEQLRSDQLGNLDLQMKTLKLDSTHLARTLLQSIQRTKLQAYKEELENLNGYKELEDLKKKTAKLNEKLTTADTNVNNLLQKVQETCRELLDNSAKDLGKKLCDANDNPGAIGSYTLPEHMADTLKSFESEVDKLPQLQSKKYKSNKYVILGYIGKLKQEVKIIEKDAQQVITTLSNKLTNHKDEMEERTAQHAQELAQKDSSLTELSQQLSIASASGDEKLVTILLTTVLPIATRIANARNNNAALATRFQRAYLGEVQRTLTLTQERDELKEALAQRQEHSPRTPDFTKKLKAIVDGGPTNGVHLNGRDSPSYTNRK